MVSFTSSALLVAAASLAAAQYGPPAPASSSSTSSSAASSSAPTAAAADSGTQLQVVTVSPNGQLAFSPQSITAPVGSKVEFDFSHITIAHSVTQGIFDSPCMPNNTGFFQGFNANPPSSASTFTIVINSTDPIFYYCSFPGHCGAGMVGVINQASGSAQTIEAYSSAAQGKTTTPGSTEQGGTVGAFVAASSGSSSGSSSSAGGSSPTSAAPSASSSAAKASGAAETTNSRFALVAMVGALTAGWVVSSLMM